jgi:branched-chain amino acid transport system ATP-binding protein
MIVDKNFAAVSAITSRNVILVKGQIVLEGTGPELQQHPDLLQRYLGI